MRVAKYLSSVSLDNVNKIRSFLRKCMLTQGPSILPGLPCMEYTL